MDPPPIDPTLNHASGRKPSSQRTRFFNEKAAAAILKHAIIQKYFAPFAGKTGFHSRNNRVTLLDGYSGPGRYADGSAGSPTLMVHTAEAMAGRRDVQCIFIERSRKFHRELERNFANHPNCWIAPLGPIEEHLDAALARAEDTPLVAFLDPFGLGIPFRMLTSKILARSELIGGRPRGPITEVLMNLSHIGIARAAGWLTNESDDPRIRRMKRAMIKRLDDLLGGPWWQSIWLGAPEGERLETILRMWVNQLTGLGWHVVRVPVARRWEGAPVYYLVFMTQSIDGLWTFNNALSLATGVFHDYCHRDRLGLDFDNDKQWIEDIKGNIASRLQAGPIVVAEPLSIATIYGDTFGHARETHVRTAIKQLHQEGLTPTTGIGKVLEMTIEPPEGSGPPRARGPQPPGARPTSGRRALALRPWESGPQPA